MIISIIVIIVGSIIVSRISRIITTSVIMGTLMMVIRQGGMTIFTAVVIACIMVVTMVSVMVLTL